MALCTMAFFGNGETKKPKNKLTHSQTQMVAAIALTQSLSVEIALLFKAMFIFMDMIYIVETTIKIKALIIGQK